MCKVHHWITNFKYIPFSRRILGDLQWSCHYLFTTKICRNRGSNSGIPHARRTLSQSCHCAGYYFSEINCFFPNWIKLIWPTKHFPVLFVHYLITYKDKIYSIYKHFPISNKFFPSCIVFPDTWLKLQLINLYFVWLSTFFQTTFSSFFSKTPMCSQISMSIKFIWHSV